MEFKGSIQILFLFWTLMNLKIESLKCKIRTEMQQCKISLDFKDLTVEKLSLRYNSEIAHRLHVIISS